MFQVPPPVMSEGIYLKARETNKDQTDNMATATSQSSRTGET